MEPMPIQGTRVIMVVYSCLAQRWCIREHEKTEFWWLGVRVRHRTAVSSLPPLSQSSHPMSVFPHSLVINNFGVKYMGKEHADHLIKCSKEKYKLTEDWAGDLYCSISLTWDYAAQTLHISMQGHIKNQLLKNKHVMRRIQHCRYSPEPKKIRHRPTIPPPQQRYSKTHQGWI